MEKVKEVQEKIIQLMSTNKELQEKFNQLMLKILDEMYTLMINTSLRISVPFHSISSDKKNIDYFFVLQTSKYDSMLSLKITYIDYIGYYERNEEFEHVVFTASKRLVNDKIETFIENNLEPHIISVFLDKMPEIFNNVKKQLEEGLERLEEIKMEIEKILEKIQ